MMKCGSDRRARIAHGAAQRCAENCRAATDSVRCRVPKFQVCSETVDICSKSMEWSMFLSWCRGTFTPFKTKKSASLNFVFSDVVYSLLLKSLLWFCNCLLNFSLRKTNFYKNVLSLQFTLFMFFLLSQHVATSSFVC